MSRYEQIPMTSQPMSSWIRSGATTTVIMAAVNRETWAA
jgi:hypothetical protein